MRGLRGPRQRPLRDRFAVCLPSRTRRAIRPPEYGSAVPGPGERRWGAACHVPSYSTATLDSSKPRSTRATNPYSPEIFSCGTGCSRFMFNSTLSRDSGRDSARPSANSNARRAWRTFRSWLRANEDSTAARSINAFASTWSRSATASTRGFRIARSNAMRAGEAASRHDEGCSATPQLVRDRDASDGVDISHQADVTA